MAERLPVEQRAGDRYPVGAPADVTGTCIPDELKPRCLLVRIQSSAPVDNVRGILVIGLWVIGVVVLLSWAWTL